MSDNSSSQIELTYVSNGGVPYKWEFEIEDESIVQFVRSYVLEDNNTGDIVGGSISTNYVFRGLKTGTTTVTFKYINIADNSVLKEEKNTLRVDSRKNIYLVVLAE